MPSSFAQASGTFPDRSGEVFDDRRSQHTGQAQRKTLPDIDGELIFRILWIQVRNLIAVFKMIMPDMTNRSRPPLLLEFKGGASYGGAAEIEGPISLLAGILQTMPIHPHV